MCPVFQVGHCAIGMFRTLIVVKMSSVMMSAPLQLFSSVFRNREDVRDRNGGSSLLADFHGLVHHQQHQTGDRCSPLSFNPDPSLKRLPASLVSHGSCKHVFSPPVCRRLSSPPRIKIQNEESVILFLVVWTLTEITRYSYYTFKLLHHLPFFIKWARFCVLACLLLS